jgi:hypothetical protein
MVEPTHNPIYRPRAMEPSPNVNIGVPTLTKHPRTMEPAPDSLPPGAIVYSAPADPNVRISKTVYINDYGSFFRVVSVQTVNPADSSAWLRHQLEVCPALLNGDMDMDDDGQPNWCDCTVAGDDDEECNAFVDLINATFCATPTSTPLFMLHDFCGR